MGQVIELDNLEAFCETRSLCLAEARSLLRGRRGDASLESMRRWSNPARGWSAPDGRRLILPCVKLGGYLRTMKSWVERFRDERLKLAVRLPRKPVEGITEGRRAKSLARAEKALDRAGVGSSKRS
jgi:hypothetical protein